MIRVYLPVLAVVLLFTSCFKKPTCNYDSCAYTAPAGEIQAVESYLTTHSITAAQHCSGVFYTITDAGTGRNPGYCSGIYVKYKGMLSDGTVFDQDDSGAPFTMDGVISGWRNVLSLIKEGGKIVLYIPPSLGYGPLANGPIPPNSMLIFEVELLSLF